MLTTLIAYQVAFTSLLDKKEELAQTIFTQKALVENGGHYQVELIADGMYTFCNQNYQGEKRGLLLPIPTISDEDLAFIYRLIDEKYGEQERHSDEQCIQALLDPDAFLLWNDLVQRFQEAFDTAIQKESEQISVFRSALDDFLASENFKPSIISATKRYMTFGSTDEIELLPDGTYRVLQSSEIGNLYETPGVILLLPIIANESLEDLEDDEAFSRAFDNEEEELKEELRQTFSE